MRGIDPQSPANQPNNTRSNEADSQERTEDDRGPAFSQVLAKKRQGGDEFDPPKSLKGEFPATMGLMQPASPFDRPLEVTAAEMSHLVEIPPQLENLVREIAVVVDKAGNQEVHIELNSNVLKGLAIRIERHDGGVGIHFQSASEDVSRLLSSNIDALTQGLANRGVEVSAIQVTSPSASARGGDESKSRQYPGGRQGGRR